MADDLYFCYADNMPITHFEWDPKKDAENLQKHRVSFAVAQFAFADPWIIAEDMDHSEADPRYYCFGKVSGEIITVRFTYRNNVIRIFGAGYWRKGKATYEHENKIHR